MTRLHVEIVDLSDKLSPKELGNDLTAALGKMGKVKVNTLVGCAHFDQSFSWR